MMPRDERDDVLGLCSDCGMDVGVDVSHVFVSEGGARLCWDCALERGGEFDEKHDRWLVPPALNGLPDERRPHA